MKLTTKVLATLVAAGIEPDTHHATIRKTCREQFDWSPDSDELQDLREALSEYEPEEQVSQEDLLDMAEVFGDAEYDDWNKVIEVTEATEKGRPARVTIECQDPQVDGNGESVCVKTRNIAIQDLFQVERCESCQARTVQLYRNRLARERRARLRKLEAKEKTKKTA